MAESVRVWVKTPVLETILHGKTRATKRRALPDASNPVAADDSGFVDWGWARGTIVRDDSATKLVVNTQNKSSFSDKETIKVEINDEESEYHRKTFDIPPDLSKDGVVMDNVWADSDDEDDSMGGGGGDFDEPSGPPDDLINLTHLHEPAVVYCLRKRYHNDEIYTATGPILLALNPFKNCKSLYSDKAMMEYSKAGEMKHLGGGGGGDGGDGDDEGGGVGDLDVLPPHVYGIADHSFRSMMSMMEQGGAGGIVPSKPRKGATGEKGFNQSILVSGESGAGKTVTTKFIMKYLATLSQRGGTKKVETDDSGGIERQVLQSNPILESFGNARTIRNDNSSRFGKFIELGFTNSGVLVGASIDTYLLEKVRLVTQMPGERNYHIFYELLVGLEEEECEKFFIGEDITAEDFKMTNASGTYDRRDGVDDFDTYADLRNAMDTMGFEKEEQDDIMSVTCAVLHLSNAKFNSISADESEIDRECDNLQAVLALLGVDADATNKALCYFTIVAGKEKHSRSLSKEKAEKGMLALIKATYGALFTHIVQRVNSCITVDDNSTSKRRKCRGPTKAASIGVLDIFGFESFKKNSFEQLCINYCNEALQQQFNLFVLKNEQDEYEREGIQWSFISFPDNQDVLDLIFKKGQGILNILDDQCRAPGTTDKTFANDLYQKCTPHSRFEADFRQVGARLFGVVHYAGCVEYDTEGFVEKNRDELPRESTDLLLGSSKPFVRKLAEILSGGAPGVSAEKSPSPAPKGRRGGPRSAGGGGRGAGKRSTVGTQFSAQLTELRNKIDLTSPHYVRCLKPNDLLVPDHFDPAIIADQLRCAGVIEAVRVSRVGYPQRYSHQNFVKRYKILAIRELKKASRSSSKRVKPCDVLVKAIAKKILKVDQALQNGGHLPGDDATVNTAATSKSKKGAAEETIDMIAVGMQVGKTKVFLRRRAYEIIERLRLQKMDRAAIQIQRVARRYIAMFNLRVALRAITLLQCLARSASARVEFLEKRRNKGVTLIANARRKHVARRTFLATLFAARWIQKVNRGRMGRAKFDRINRDHKSITIQTYYRRYYLRQRFRKMVSTAWMVQCAYRCHVAKIELKGLKATARDMGAVTEERDQLKVEVQQLRKELADAKRKAKADAAQVSAAAAAANDLKIARQEAAEMNKLKEEIEQITLERDKAWQKYKDQTDKSKSLETTLSDKAAEVKQQKEVVNKMKKELVGAGKASQALKATLTEDISKLENTIESLKTQLKESNDAVANASKAAAIDMEEVQRLRKELESATDELEGLRSEMDDARNKLADTETELNDAREEISAAAVSAHPAASNGVSSEELELLKASEETLKKETDQLREEISKAQNATADIEIKAKAQVEAAEKIASQLGTELEDTKQKLADAEKRMEAEVARAAAEATEAAATSHSKARSDMSTDIMPNGLMGNAEVEVDYLQNEIMRLEKELSDTKEELENGTGGGGGGMVNNDPTSQEHLIARYEELRRLSDANLQKDQEIEAMKREIESLKVELNANGIANYNNYDEDDEDGASSLGFNDVTNPRNDENDPFFTAGPAGGRRKSPSHEASDKTALQAVNDMLRVEVEQLRVDLAAAQEKAKVEAQNSARDLEAFSEALRGVDEMRRAAEAMSRELNKRRRKRSLRGEHWDRFSDRDDVSIMSGGTELFNEARKILDKSQNEEKKINAIWARVKATVSMSSLKEDDHW